MENRGGKDNEVSGGMWEAVETSTEEVGIGEAKGRRGKGRGWEKEGRKEEENENEKGKDNGGEESSGEMGDI